MEKNFCGSGVVSEYLLQQYDILAVDIQNYSKVYCEARLTGGTQDMDFKRIESDIKGSLIRKINLDDYKPVLDYEDKSMAALINERLEPMYEIIEKGSLYAYLGKFEYAKGDLSSELEKAFSEVEKNVSAKRESTDSVIVRYYGGLYFSYKQAIDIDERPQNEHNFAVVCDDYIKVLQKLKPGDIKVVYADPPYTRYHYSRYYHILETLCLHDNPQISTTFLNGKGGLSRAIYRNDRHQSPFCIKSKAPKAFDDMFKYVNEAQASIVLSYSPFDAKSGATPRLLTIDEIVNIAKKYYGKVEVVSPGQFMHSRFNKQDNNYEINYEAERLIICRK